MLRDLYPRHHRQYEGSRCGAELEAFASWLEEQGHLRHPLRLHLYRARQALDHSDRFQSGSVFKEDDVREAFVVSGTDTYLYIYAPDVSFSDSWRPRAAWFRSKLSMRMPFYVVAIAVISRR
jgi:hypothetical protein